MDPVECWEQSNASGRSGWNGAPEEASVALLRVSIGSLGRKARLVGEYLLIT